MSIDGRQECPSYFISAFSAPTHFFNAGTGFRTVNLFTEEHAALTGARDVVMGFPTWFSLGFWKPSPELDFGSSRRAIGSAGAGGSFAYADPDRQLGYAYVMNRMEPGALGDPRGFSLLQAAYASLAG